MTDREQYTPGPASRARVVRELRHPAHLREWAPFEAPAPHALPDRLEDHLDGRAPADMFKRFADVRSLYG
jgi:hypothetical protein